MAVSEQGGKKVQRDRQDTMVRIPESWGCHQQQYKKIPQHGKYRTTVEFGVWDLQPEVLGSNPRSATSWLCEPEQVT